MMSKRQFNRREFIVTSVAGGLAIGFRVPPGGDLSGAAIGEKPWEPRASASDVELNAWLVIKPDDEVIIRVAQSEMGQGTFTSWAKMIVEELQCDWSKVHTEYASANRHFRENKVYQRMGTSSSSSVRLSRKYLQQAGASARERLMAAAAQEWGVDRSQLKAENGVVIHTPSGRRLRFGQLVEKASTIQLEREPEIKTPDQFTFMNKPTKLLETPLRVNGAATYGLDIRLPGMLYAAVKASPVFYGKVKSYDFEAIKDRPGVHSAVAFGIDNSIEHGVAVIADSYWR
ncbi:MAG: molybdopterin cofactor-binding domain-containing protein, partial [Acidobacteriota bacterium]